MTTLRTWLHRRLCLACRDGARPVIVSGRLHHIAPRMTRLQRELFASTITRS